MSLTTMFILGGAGLTLGFLDMVLKSMGKENISILINTLAMAGLGLYAMKLIEKLFSALQVFL